MSLSIISIFLNPYVNSDNIFFITGILTFTILQNNNKVPSCSKSFNVIDSIEIILGISNIIL